MSEKKATTTLSVRLDADRLALVTVRVEEEMPYPCTRHHKPSFEEMHRVIEALKSGNFTIKKQDNE